MTEETWVTLGALVAGYVLRVASEALGDRRRHRRESTIRRQDFQRTTLLDLQVALSGLMRAYGQVHLIRSEQEAKGISWRDVVLQNDLDEELRRLENETALLASRVEDDDVRIGVDRIKRFGTAITMGQDPHEHAFLAALPEGFRLLNRMGQLIRELL